MKSVCVSTRAQSSKGEEEEEVGEGGGEME